MIEGRPAPGAGFVWRVALAMSLVAMSIDAMLPALSDIARDLGAAGPNDRQLVLTAFFGGLTVGQLVAGPLSDAIGRKATLLAGLALYVTGGVLCAAAWSFPVVVLGRVLQGLGVAGPRIVAVAMVRDVYQGSAMARVMSYVMSIFILVPILAPGVGQLVLLVAPWRAIFGVLVAMALIAAAWFALGQAETLPRDRRVPLAPRTLARGVVECVSHRATLCYMLAGGLMFAAFVAYLATSQQIFQERYGLGALFPVAFGTLAASYGAASFTNARLVMRFGMRRMAVSALAIGTAVSIGFLGVALVAERAVPLLGFMAYMMVTFFSVGILFGNLNAMAMAPMGHIAGLASAVIGSVSTLVSVVVGTPIGRAYDGTIVPLVAGFAATQVGALVLVRLAERGATASSPAASQAQAQAPGSPAPPGRQAP